MKIKEIWYLAHIDKHKGYYSMFFMDFPHYKFTDELKHECIIKAKEGLEMLLSDMLYNKEVIPEPVEYGIANYIMYFNLELSRKIKDSWGEEPLVK